MMRRNGQVSSTEPSRAETTVSLAVTRIAVIRRRVVNEHTQPESDLTLIEIKKSNSGAVRIVFRDTLR